MNMSGAFCHNVNDLRACDRASDTVAHHLMLIATQLLQCLLLLSWLAARQQSRSHLQQLPPATQLLQSYALSHACTDACLLILTTNMTGLNIDCVT